MRLGILVCATCTLVLPVIAVAQDPPTTAPTNPPTVIRPAPMPGWRNYLTVPDGPCGCPMAVETDCYPVCRPCGPLHPICFLHRVGRMLDSLLPCNMCCRGGHGCGLFHGCHLGGRTWGHCGVCCGTGSCGGYGGGACGGCGGGACGGGGCTVNPCGSAFAPIPTTGGHCYGCGSAIPTLTDPFIDDPAPPRPIASPSSEVRHAPATRPQAIVSRPPPTTSRVQSMPTAPPRNSPYKIVNAPQRPSARPAEDRSEPPTVTIPASRSRSTSNGSVLRRASVEEEATEPAALEVDHSRAAPIIRYQSPDEGYDYAAPRNPLRK